jgi:putative ABC transport system permease protein
MHSLWQDVRYGMRLLRLNPAFTVVAILSLALGIGANTSIFQLIDAVRLRTIPVKNPQELATVRIADRTWGSGNFDGDYPELTHPIWQQIRQRQEAFSSIGAFFEDSFNLATGGEVRNAKGLWVTGNFFRTLGVQPALGRLISESDDQPGCPGVANLSYAFWQRGYGGEASAIGRQITMEGHPFQIVGITAPAFRGVSVGETFDVAVPVCTEPIIRGEFSHLNVRRDWWLAAIGRLKPGWTIEKATAQLNVISPQILQETIPETYDAEGVKHYLAYRFAAFPASTGFSALRKDYEKPLYLLLGIAALVLLIACANLANLMLARATAREREISVRLALGASRARLIRQLLSESLLLAIAGAVCGAVLARELSEILVVMMSTMRNPIFLDLTTDWRVLGFTSALAVLTTLIFGLTPALRAAGADPNAALKATRGMTAGRERFGIRRTLVVTQVALSMVLLVAALLFVRSFRNLLTVDAGFRQKGILLAYIDFTKLNVPGPRRDDFKQDLVERLRAVPGVEAIAGAQVTPVGGSYWNDSIIGNSNADEKGSSWEAYVTPGYFSTLETPLIQGRDFESSDGPGAPKVAIVNQAFVRKYLDSNSSPIGKQFHVWQTPGKPPRIYQVIGVVKNTKYQNMHEDFKPIMFFPIAQDEQTIPIPWAAVVIRSRDLSEPFVAGVREAITRVNPTIDIDFRIFAEQVRDSLLQDRLMATLSGFFGFLAALLAAMGLYGVMSYMVVQRTNEIGIRMALGAQSKQVLSMILREAGVLVLVGAAVGTALALLAAHTATSLLFGLKPRDPLTYLIAIVVLSTAAALASSWPAYRASRLDPMAALRYE